MAEVVVKIPEELKKGMDSVPEMNWSEIAREAITKNQFKEAVKIVSERIQA